MTSAPPPSPEGNAPPQGYPPPGYQQPYPPAPYGYPPPGHYPYPPPRRSKTGLIVFLSFLGFVAIAAALIFLTPVGKFLFGSGFMESNEEFSQRMAESEAEATAVMSDRYLSARTWCDSRGGQMVFSGGIGEVAFYRNQRLDSLISRARYTLSGNRLMIASTRGTPVVADLVRIDGSTMTMTITGRTETLRHCS